MVVRGKRVITMNPDTPLPCPDDKVNRVFKADRPNKLWVSDFTYVPTCPPSRGIRADHRAKHAHHRKRDPQNRCPVATKPCHTITAASQPVRPACLRSASTGPCHPGWSKGRICHDRHNDLIDSLKTSIAVHMSPSEMRSSPSISLPVKCRRPGPNITVGIPIEQA